MIRPRHGQSGGQPLQQPRGTRAGWEMGASTSRVTPRPVMPAVKPTWLEVLPSGPRPALARIRESLIVWSKSARPQPSRGCGVLTKSGAYGEVGAAIATAPTSRIAHRLLGSCKKPQIVRKMGEFSGRLKGVQRTVERGLPDGCSPKCGAFPKGPKLAAWTSYAGFAHDCGLPRNSSWLSPRCRRPRRSCGPAFSRRSQSYRQRAPRPPW